MPSAGPGTDYGYVLPDHDGPLPDPRSPWQPGGVHGLAIRLALAVNRALGRKGQVVGDRYHARALTTPRVMRTSMVYVLLNFRKHLRAPACIDPRSSGAHFWGWQRTPVATALPPATATPPSSPAEPTPETTPVAAETVIAKGSPGDATLTAEPAPSLDAGRPPLEEPTFEQIQLRAYFISERRRNAGLPGDDQSDWLQAREELINELKGH